MPTLGYCGRVEHEGRTSSAEPHGWRTTIKKGGAEEGLVGLHLRCVQKVKGSAKRGSSFLFVSITHSHTVSSGSGLSEPLAEAYTLLSLSFLVSFSLLSSPTSPLSPYCNALLLSLIKTSLQVCLSGMNWCAVVTGGQLGGQGPEG